MTLKLHELEVPEDLLERYGLRGGWHGDTHSDAGKELESAKGKPKVVRSTWFPGAAQPDDPVEELHILYDDGTVVRVPAEKFRRAP